MAAPLTNCPLTPRRSYTLLQPCRPGTRNEIPVLSLAKDTAPDALGSIAEPLQTKNGAGVLVFYPGSFMAQANGSQARAASLVQHLAETRSDVTIYSYGNVAEPWTPGVIEAFRQRYPNVQLLVEDESRALALAKWVKKSLIQLYPRANVAILGKEVPGLAPKLRRWKREHPDGVYVINYVDNVSRLNGLPPSRTIVETHDFQYFRRSKGAAGMLWSLPGLLRLRHEVATLSAVGGVVAISRTEEYVYRNLAQRSRVFFVPLYERVQVAADSKPAEDYRYDLLFVGSANKVNELGLLQFISGCPWLRQYRIAVCGKICELETVRTLARTENNVKLLGFQDDLGSVYQSAKACLCPTHGTGLNIKILEALAYGKAVFASRDAMDALPGGFEACVFPLDSSKISSVLSSPTSLQAASQAAMEYYCGIPAAGDIRGLDAYIDQFSAPGGARDD